MLWDTNESRDAPDRRRQDTGGRESYCERNSLKLHLEEVQQIHSAA